MRPHQLVSNVSRRAVVLGLAAGSFALSVRAGGPAIAQAKSFGADAMPGGIKDDPRIFVSIAEDGTVTLLCNRTEMGQGVRTSWAMVVADERWAAEHSLKPVGMFRPIRIAVLVSSQQISGS